MVLVGSPPAVVLNNPKFPHNVGNVLRACYAFGIGQLWWTGTRIDVGERLPREERMRQYTDQVQLVNHEYPLRQFEHGTPVIVEVKSDGMNLVDFEHPGDAIYIFGPEDGSVNKALRHTARHFVYIPTHVCLNLGNAVTTVLYDRRMKRILNGSEQRRPLDEMLGGWGEDVDTWLFQGAEQ